MTTEKPLTDKQIAAAKKRKAATAKSLVGKRVRWEYPAPAITCESNGRIIKLEGEVKRILQNPTQYFGDHTLEVELESGRRMLARLGEIQSYLAETGRWRKFSFPRNV